MNKALLAALAIVAVAGITFGVIEMGGNDPARIEQLTRDLDKAQKDLAERARQMDALREENANLKTERDGFAKTIDSLEAQLKQLRANAEKNAGIAAAPASSDQPKKTGGRGDMMAIARGFMKNLDDPAFRKAVKSGQERQIAAAYGPLFKKLGLDDATAKLAADLIADRSLDAMQKGRKLVDGDDTTDGAMGDVRKAVEGVKSDYDTKLKSVLGAQNFQEFNTYEQTMGDTRSIDQMSRNFDKSGTPLQPDQRDALTNIMREERLKNPSNEIPDLGGGPGMSILMSDTEAKAQQQQEDDFATRVVNRASQAGLSPDQVNTLQDSFKQQNENRTMGRAMGRMFLGGGGR